MKSIKQILKCGAAMLAMSLAFTACGNIDNPLEELQNSTTPAPEPEPPYNAKATPLTLELVADGACTVTFNNRANGPVTYQVNDEEPQTIAKLHNQTITLEKAGDKVAFYGDNDTYYPSNYSNIKCTAKCYVYGNIMSLISSTDFENATALTKAGVFYRLFEDNQKIDFDPSRPLILPATELKNYCYNQMFDGCTGITNLPEKLLPAKTLAEGCYYNMFSGCTGLTTLPEKLLPATTLADCCYEFMFDGCKGLTNLPEKLLPAKTLAERCYQQMFVNCTGLKTLPENLLPATTLTYYCYDNMFSDCTGLETLPENLLPATMLADGCYSEMFSHCSSLENTPQLPATLLKKECYEKMFSGCTNLKEARVKAAYTNTNDECKEMFTGCTNASTSKFYTDGTWSDWKAAFPNINNWTNYPYTPGIVEGKFSVSATQKVCFSQGNLQYTKSTGIWSFMEHQWSTVETLNQNVGTNYAEQDVVSLFGWGTSGYKHGATCYQPYSTSSNYNDYNVYSDESKNLFDGTGKADWGYNKISNGGDTENNGWRTLSKDEWEYLLITRTTTSGIRYAKAKVGDVNGMILLPDDWSTSYYTLSSTEDFTANVITSVDWTNKLEAHGAVFLPTAGYRSGSSVGYVNSKGHYWSSTNRGGDGWCLSIVSTFNSSDFLGPALFYCGLSVRLVRDVE